jgi:ubiquitin C-terminal hydrolase
MDLRAILTAEDASEAMNVATAALLDAVALDGWEAAAAFVRATVQLIREASPPPPPPPPPSTDAGGCNGDKTSTDIVFPALVRFSETKKGLSDGDLHLPAPALRVIESQAFYNVLAALYSRKCWGRHHEVEHHELFCSVVAVMVPLLACDRAPLVLAAFQVVTLLLGGSPDGIVNSSKCESSFQSKAAALLRSHEREAATFTSGFYREHGGFISRALPGKGPILAWPNEKSVMEQHFWKALKGVRFQLSMFQSSEPVVCRVARYDVERHMIYAHVESPASDDALQASREEGWSALPPPSEEGETAASPLVPPGGCRWISLADVSYMQRLDEVVMPGRLEWVESDVGRHIWVSGRGGSLKKGKILDIHRLSGGGTEEGLAVVVQFYGSGFAETFAAIELERLGLHVAVEVEPFLPPQPVTGEHSHGRVVEDPELSDPPLDSQEFSTASAHRHPEAFAVRPAVDWFLRQSVGYKSLLTTHNQYRVDMVNSAGFAGLWHVIFWRLAMHTPQLPWDDSGMLLPPWPNSVAKASVPLKESPPLNLKELRALLSLYQAVRDTARPSVGRRLGTAIVWASFTSLTKPREECIRGMSMEELYGLCERVVHLAQYATWPSAHEGNFLPALPGAIPSMLPAAWTLEPPLSSCATMHIQQERTSDEAVASDLASPAAAEGSFSGEEWAAPLVDGANRSDLCLANPKRPGPVLADAWGGRLLLELHGRLLHASQIDKQVAALDRIVSLVTHAQTLVDHARGSHTPRPVLESVSLRLDEFTEWVLSQRILETVFGERDGSTHHELVSRSGPFLTFLARQGHLSPRHLQLAWRAASGKHAATERVIFEAIVAVVPHLSKELRRELDSLVGKIPFADWNERVIATARDLTLTAASADLEDALEAIGSDEESAEASPTSPAATASINSHGLDLMWRFILDRSGAASSRPPPSRLVHQAIESIVEMLSSLRAVSDRRLLALKDAARKASSSTQATRKVRVAESFVSGLVHLTRHIVDRCVACIDQQTSAGQALLLLPKLLRTLPSDAAAVTSTARSWFPVASSGTPTPLASLTVASEFARLQELPEDRKKLMDIFFSEFQGYTLTLQSLLERPVAELDREEEGSSLVSPGELSVGLAATPEREEPADRPCVDEMRISGSPLPHLDQLEARLQFLEFALTVGNQKLSSMSASALAVLWECCVQSSLSDKSLDMALAWIARATVPASASQPAALGVEVGRSFLEWIRTWLLGPRHAQVAAAQRSTKEVSLVGGALGVRATDSSERLPRVRSGIAAASDAAVRLSPVGFRAFVQLLMLVAAEEGMVSFKPWPDSKTATPSASVDDLDWSDPCRIHVKGVTVSILPGENAWAWAVAHNRSRLFGGLPSATSGAAASEARPLSRPVQPPTQRHITGYIKCSTSEAIPGVDALWVLAVHAKDPVVGAAATDLLVTLHSALSKTVEKRFGPSLRLAFVRTSLGYIRSTMDIRDGVASGRYAPDAVPAPRSEARSAVTDAKGAVVPPTPLMSETPDDEDFAPSSKDEPEDASMAAAAARVTPSREETHRRQMRHSALQRWARDSLPGVHRAVHALRVLMEGVIWQPDASTADALDPDKEGQVTGPLASGASSSERRVRVTLDPPPQSLTGGGARGGATWSWPLTATLTPRQLIGSVADLSGWSVGDVLLRSESGDSRLPARILTELDAPLVSLVPKTTSSDPVVLSALHRRGSGFAQIPAAASGFVGSIGPGEAQLRGYGLHARPSIDARPVSSPLNGWWREPDAPWIPSGGGRPLSTGSVSSVDAALGLFRPVPYALALDGGLELPPQLAATVPILGAEPPSPVGAVLTASSASQTAARAASLMRPQLCTDFDPWSAPWPFGADLVPARADAALVAMRPLQNEVSSQASGGEVDPKVAPIVPVEVSLTGAPKYAFDRLSEMGLTRGDDARDALDTMYSLLSLEGSAFEMGVSVQSKFIATEVSSAAWGVLQYLPTDPRRLCLLRSPKAVNGVGGWNMVLSRAASRAPSGRSAFSLLYDLQILDVLIHGARVEGISSEEEQRAKMRKTQGSKLPYDAVVRFNMCRTLILDGALERLAQIACGTGFIGAAGPACAAMLFRIVHSLLSIDPAYQPVDSCAPLTTVGDAKAESIPSGPLGTGGALGGGRAQQRASAVWAARDISNLSPGVALNLVNPHRLCVAVIEQMLHAGRARVEAQRAWLALGGTESNRPLPGTAASGWDGCGVAIQGMQILASCVTSRPEECLPALLGHRALVPWLRHYCCEAAAPERHAVCHGLLRIVSWLPNPLPLPGLVDAAADRGVTPPGPAAVMLGLLLPFLPTDASRESRSFRRRCGHLYALLGGLLAEAATRERESALRNVPVLGHRSPTVGRLGRSMSVSGVPPAPPHAESLESVHSAPASSREAVVKSLDAASRFLGVGHCFSFLCKQVLNRSVHEGAHSGETGADYLLRGAIRTLRVLLHIAPVLRRTREAARMLHHVIHRVLFPAPSLEDPPLPARATSPTSKLSKDSEGKADDSPVDREDPGWAGGGPPGHIVEEGEVLEEGELECGTARFGPLAVTQGTRVCAYSLLIELAATDSVSEPVQEEDGTDLPVHVALMSTGGGWGAPVSSTALVPPSFDVYGALRLVRPRLPVLSATAPVPGPLQLVGPLCLADGSPSAFESGLGAVDRSRLLLQCLDDAWRSGGVIPSVGDGEVMDTSEADRWRVDPSTLNRGSRPFVGLRNLGATCYMNSTLQQLFCTPQFRRGLLQADLPAASASHRDVLVALQELMGFLAVSTRRWADTSNMGKAFRELDGSPLRTGEHKDAQEFLMLLFDRLEAASPEVGKLVRDTFGGTTVNQIISLESPFVSEREENFTLLSVEVEGLGSLDRGLEAFGEGETLTGDNRYKLPDGRRVDAKKRSLPRDLPPKLLIHLNRLKFDVATLSRKKVNDFCSFPSRLDMWPYSLEGVVERERAEGIAIGSSASDGSDKAGPRHPRWHYQYELTGIVVHVGGADAGHYYSFVKSASPASGAEQPAAGTGDFDGDWWELNDRTVKRLDPSMIPDLCFGGEETVPSVASAATGSAAKVTRSKSLNAFILVYERARPPVVSAPKVPLVTHPPLMRLVSNGDLAEPSLGPDVDVGPSPDHFGTPHGMSLPTPNLAPVTENSPLVSRAAAKSERPPPTAMRELDLGAPALAEPLPRSPPRVAPAHVTQAIWSASRGFVLESLMFSPEFLAFVWNVASIPAVLEEGATSDGWKCPGDVQAGAVSLAVRAWSDVVIRASKGIASKVGSDAWTSALRLAMDLSPLAARAVLQRASLDSDWRHRLILRCPLAHVRRQSAGLLLRAVRALADEAQRAAYFEGLELGRHEDLDEASVAPDVMLSTELVVSEGLTHPTARTVLTLLADLRVGEGDSILVPRLGEVYLLLRGIALTGPSERLLLAVSGFVRQACMHAVMDLRAVEIGAERSSGPQAVAAPSMAHLFEAMCLAVRGATESDMVPPSFLNPALSHSMLAQLLYFHSAVGVSAMEHLVRNDLVRSDRVTRFLSSEIEALSSIVSKGTPDARLKAALAAAVAIFAVSDDLTDERASPSGLISAMLHAGSVLLRYSRRNPVAVAAVAAVAGALFEASKRSPRVADVLRDTRSEWREWLGILG